MPAGFKTIAITAGVVVFFCGSAVFGPSLYFAAESSARQSRLAMGDARTVTPAALSDGNQARTARIRSVTAASIPGAPGDQTFQHGHP